MMLSPRAPLGWWLLVGSVLLNLALGGLLLNKRSDTTKEEALLFALDRCQNNIARYAEVKAVADAYDKMVAERK